MTDHSFNVDAFFTGAPLADHAPRALIDAISGERHPIDSPNWRSNAGRPMLVSPGPGIDRADLDSRARGVWRFRASFPIDIDDPITMGEGVTPLVQLRADTDAASHRPRSTLDYCKLEWFSPSGSFKDRGASVMLSALRQRGVTSVLEDSSGNGGAAVAAYGAAGGLDVTVFAPATTSPAKLVQSRAYGAELRLIEGPREASQDAAIVAEASGAGVYASHNWQALFIEGVKTLAYELWEDFAYEAPEHVIMPVGAGSSLLGCALGFAELKRAGQIDRLPRLWAAQPLACSPVDAAFNGEAQGVRPVTPTIAEGTAIAKPLRLPEMLAALRVSGGGTVAIPESEILSAHAELAGSGLYAEPTSATAVAALRRLRASGRISPEERAVTVLTGSGLKSPMSAS